MKKIFLALILVILLAGSALAGEVLAVFKAPEGAEVSAAGFESDSEGSLMASAAKTASEVDAEIIQVYKNLSELDGNIFVLLRSKNKTTEELISALKARPDVITASPNHKFKMHSMRKSDSGIRPNDPDFDLLWGLEAVRAPEAWTETTGSENVYVAVIDSGFYIHEDLKGNLAEELGYNIALEKNEGWSTDSIGHGTHIAGIIGAVGDNNTGIAGVNWNVKIIPVSFMTTQDENESNDKSGDDNNEENSENEGESESSEGEQEESEGEGGTNEKKTRHDRYSCWRL